MTASFPLTTVGALVIAPDGRGLFIRTHKWRDRYGVPGGKVHYGESLEAALRRELREETGLELEDIRFALVQEAALSPEFHVPAHFVLLNYVAKATGTAVTLNDEAQAHVWATPAEARALDLNGPTRALVEHALASGAWA